MNKTGGFVLQALLSIALIIWGISKYIDGTETHRTYMLIVGGGLWLIYDIYLIATHRRKTQDEQEVNRKLAEQGTFNNAQAEISSNISEPDNANNETGVATIIVHWYKEKMGFGDLPVSVNGVVAGVIEKGNLQVTYHTNVPFNTISMGVYKTEINLSQGDTVEYFVAGNGIRHHRTILTKGSK